jgi:hypothetical protein
VLPADAQSEVKEKAAGIFGEQMDFTIDGRPARPIPDRVSFLRRTLRSSIVVDRPEDLERSMFGGLLTRIYLETRK